MQKRTAAAAADGEAEAVELGATLREARLAQGRDLRDLAQTLRIRAVYLEAIESGRFNDLPGPAYASGFLRTYADYLRLDPEQIVNRYRTATAGAERQVGLVLPSPTESGHLPTGSILLLAAIIGIGAYGVWYYMSVQGRDPIAMLSAVPNQIAGWIGGDRPASKIAASTVSPRTEQPAEGADGAVPGSSESITSTAPSSPSTEPQAVTARPILLPSVVPEAADPFAGRPTSRPGDAAIAAVTPSLPAPGAETEAIRGPDRARRRIMLRAVADSWVEIRSPGESPIFSRVLRNGETYDVPERSGLSLTTGNAAGIVVVIDGATMPALGPQGAVVRNIALDPDRLRTGGALSR